MATSYAQDGDAAGTFLGHPKGLFVLFFAEMWERFSYYGMRALLIFYLTKHWLFSDEKSGVIYGAYTALVYITPVLGGYLADRYLGQRKAVTYGAVLLTFGHFLMGFEGSGGQDAASLNIFWLALAFIIVGSGFLKANISVIVGQLYPRTDVRRDGAYTIFYMGINLGAALGALLCGYLGETFGWSYGFGAAGVGMLLGLIVFIVFKPLLLGRGEPLNPEALNKTVLGIKLEWLLYLVGLVAVVVCWWLVQNQAVVGSLLGAAGAILVVYVLWTAVRKLEPHDRDRIFAAMFLIIGSILFWALFEQAGSSLNLFTDRHVDRSGVPASVFQSLNAIYIVLLAPLFAWLWTTLGRKGLEPSAPAKFGLGIVQLGIGFLVLVAGSAAAGDSMVPVLFIFLIYLFHTTGELCLSPVGLSAMNRLAPAHLASLIMGTWFFASATGNFAAGLISAATGSEAASGEGAGREVVMAVYSQIGWIAIGVGIAVVVISPLIKKLMHLDSLRDDGPVEGQA
ncbi:MAG: peptide MFS transporter [Sphingorhabdus sp.]|jgi:proton-dependent oligopeptide transporter, POT family|uniref:peptide MFS transporter n=3 Tax=Sphingorhabdus sp. TaxID=1902408 RepID=UPI00273D76D6|nr:peptide MFS transporter [Sphingorhabdus sp.]MDP4872540.1 peptide MFS transporter [Sphingorhabdus sp.]MDP4926524.1 peptide MFS transporter [Sphingorhabdus sp.]